MFQMWSRWRGAYPGLASSGGRLATAPNTTKKENKMNPENQTQSKHVVKVKCEECLSVTYIPRAHLGFDMPKGIGIGDHFPTQCPICGGLGYVELLEIIRDPENKLKQEQK